MMNGTYTPQEEGSHGGSADVQGEQCRDMGGACCSCYNSNSKAFRTAVILMLKTPYCIGFLAAVILNLIMPEDKVDEYTGDLLGAQATSTTVAPKEEPKSPLPANQAHA